MKLLDGLLGRERSAPPVLAVPDVDPLPPSKFLRHEHPSGRAHASIHEETRIGSVRGRAAFGHEQVEITIHWFGYGDDIVYLRIGGLGCTAEIHCSIDAIHELAWVIAKLDELGPRPRPGWLKPSVVDPT